MEFKKNNVSEVDNLPVNNAIEGIGIVKLTAIPQQPNGSDCGAYALQYASVLISKWPWLSTDLNIQGKFSDYISDDSFGQEEIDIMRVDYKSWIDAQVLVYDEEQKKKDSDIGATSGPDIDNSPDIVTINGQSVDTCWVSTKDCNLYYKLSENDFKALAPAINGIYLYNIYICIYYTTYIYILYNI